MNTTSDNSIILFNVSGKTICMTPPVEPKKPLNFGVLHFYVGKDMPAFPKGKELRFLGTDVAGFVENTQSEIWKEFPFPSSAVIYQDNDEIVPGMAIGGLFASSNYMKGDHEYYATSGRSFGWCDLATGQRYTEDKKMMRRPTIDEWNTIFQPYYDQFKL